MKNILKRIRRRLMKYKNYIARTTTYISIINYGMILFLFLSKLKELEIINVELDKYFLLLFVGGLLLLLCIGWFDINILRGMQEERSIIFELTPPWKEMKDKVNDLWEKRNEN